MDISSIVEIVTGEAGAFGTLVLVLILLINGRLVPKDYATDLKEENSYLKEMLTEQTEAMKSLAKGADEALENSRTTLKILDAIRASTGIRGDTLDG